MMPRDVLKLWLVVMIIEQNSALSFNRPKFCSNASWDANAQTFVNTFTTASSPWDIFISTNNTIYVTSAASDLALVWDAGSNTPIRDFSNFSNPRGIFLTTTNEIYFGVDDSSSCGIDKWSWNSTSGTAVMYTCYPCYDVFVDHADNLYCSILGSHQVVRKPLQSYSNALTIVAGTGIAGNTATRLNGSWGIFVDTNLDLYVADSKNDRIQLFRAGQLTAITVAGSTSVNVTITLSSPSSIALDADGYLFIVDQNNHRIVGSGPNGFRCIVACSNGSGSTSDKLHLPYSFAFDSDGNIFVTDYMNNRIQTFTLTTNSCDAISSSSMPNPVSLTIVLQPIQNSAASSTAVASSPPVLSYNQPKFCANATWNPNATTFANASLIGSSPFGIHITTNNTVYTLDRTNVQLLVWFRDGTNLTQVVSGGGSSLRSLFVHSNGNIYIDAVKQVDRWTLRTNTSAPVMYMESSCYGVFVDVERNLYCSLFDSHQVISTSLNSQSSITTIVAGTGCIGSTAYTLENPWGIFVDTNLDLYVADSKNHRIQLFTSGQLNAITVAGSSSVNFTITLSLPSSIVLDADGYLFIVDQNNHRIVGSGPNGFGCVVGCSVGSGSASHQLSSPRSLAFDSDGNMFVVDSANNRIQTFTLTTNSCSELTTAGPTGTMTSAQTSIGKLTTAQTTTMLHFSCSAPTITLIPGSSTLSAPLQFRRSQDFYVVSLVGLNCNSSLSPVFQWTIKSCNSSCLHSSQADPSLIATSSELYISARTLPYGVYELQITVNQSQLSSTSSAFVQITPSDAIPNLIRYGTLTITRGSQQDLQFNPGSYSVDPDQDTFNASSWKYRYYCRVYGTSTFPSLQGSLLTIDDMRNDSANPSCLSNRTGWKFDNAINSSLTILSGSLQSNRTYQFMVHIENLQNLSRQATGYVFVEVVDTYPNMVLIRCVIWTLCEADMEFQRVNPATQVALASECNGNCTTLQNITWNVYYGRMNASVNRTTWMLFNQSIAHAQTWFYGVNTANFTATNQLFLSYPQFDLWRFEVVYTFSTEVTLSALNFVINRPPSNGSCSISPPNGTTTTPFTISCPDWFDEDEIKDYSIARQSTIVAFSAVPTFTVRLPISDNQTSSLHLTVHIRDQLDSLTEVNLTQVTVIPDSTAMTNLIDDIRMLSGGNTSNPILLLLASENQNLVSQVLTSVSQQLNSLNQGILDEAIAHGVSATSISISSLATGSPSAATSLNQSTLLDYKQTLNVQATVRDHLFSYATNLPITTSNSVRLQAAVLAELTKASNELTRTALTIASTRCNQLAKALDSMKMKIPFEDAQAAAIALLQCAVNLLTAVNGPLQQRAIPLDLDVARATAFPADYDTDLESEWANPNLFADGNDFSWETIQNNRNSYYQRQLANQIFEQTNELIALITSSLNIHLNIGQDFDIDTPQGLMFLEAKSIASLSTPFVQGVGSGQIQLPPRITAVLNNSNKMTIRSMLIPLAPFGNSTSSPNINLSRSISLSFIDENDNEMPVRMEPDALIEVLVPRDPQLFVPSMLWQNVTLIDSTPYNMLFHLHYVNLSSALPISVHWEIQPLNITLAYLLVYRFDNIPQLSSWIHAIDGWTLLCPSNLSNDSIYRYFIDNQRTVSHRAVVIGLRELNLNETSQQCPAASISDPPIVNGRVNFTSNYRLRTSTSGCFHLDSNSQWKADGLTVGPRTDHYQTQCFSTHVATFAGGFIVLPESVDWSYVFANADFMRNKTVYLTVIIVTVLYLILIVYARLYDKKDLEKLGVTPLLDNHPADKYFYQMIVFTGQRKNAGTQSNVHFVIHGDDDATEIRTLADPHRRILQRGGIDAFLFSVPNSMIWDEMDDLHISLGPLNCMQIWHDNTGKGSSASWFLKYIIVRDLQTMEKSHFICQRWFAVEKDDGKIERVLPVSGDIEKRQFSYLLNKRTYHSVSDGHLWFSIFSRPPSNQFTRVQRCTCCFVLLFVSMCLNILYYDLSTQTHAATPVDLPFGVLYIAPQQIVIGVIVEVLVLIPSLLLVQLFRRLGPRQQQQQSPLRQALAKVNHDYARVATHTDRKKKKLLPWWCIFIVYGLCLILVAVSILFIIARGIEFGDVKTRQWLASIVSGFFSSILLTQPLKIISLAIFFALVCGKFNDDKEAQEFLDDHPIGLDPDEEYLHDIQKRSLFTCRPAVDAKRLNEWAVERARYQRLQEMHMWSILREVFIYVCFLSLLYAVTFSNYNVYSSTQVNHLRKYLLNSRQADLDYNKITSINEYWNWLEKSFVGKLRAQQWYNNAEPRNLSGFLEDKSSRLIGWPTMRQLRVKTSSCSQGKSLFAHCRYDYSWRSEERDSFEPGWVRETRDKFNSVIRRAFQYQSGKQLDTYSYTSDHARYAAGGYVYEFRGRLSDLRSNSSQLHKLGWIDNRTRAVIIQMTVYNPNVDLFTSVILLAGRRPALLSPLVSNRLVSTLICTTAYLVMLVYFMWVEVRVFMQLRNKYFCRFWSLIDMGSIVCSWASALLYIWRHRECRRIVGRFAETNGYVYVNLQLVAYVNNVLTILIGFCCFFGTIKLIRLCRFHSRLCLFLHTLQRAAKELLSFSVLFALVFMPFVCLFHLLFISKMSECSSVLGTVQMLFEMTLMKFDAHKLSGAASFFGPFCFSLFIVLVVFVCLSMFLTIISDHFRNARMAAEKDKGEIFMFMWDRFQRWSGWKKVTEEERQAHRDEEMRSQYYETMELFVKRIDQLLVALNRVYLAQTSDRQRTGENTSV